MASLLINLFYSCQSFGRHTPAVLSPTAVIQVKVDPRCGCGGITAGKNLPAVETCTEHRVGLRWAKNPSPLAWVGL